ncbi:MAG: NTP transferase domain-containing protein [Chthonomonas sp.]|nr:NTP transferase domain-containing protein [Chthonomonas sp.]
MKGVILAAGKGSRLYPVTHHIAKPLLPMANRMTMEYAFDRLKEMGVTEICIVVGENEPEMRRALGDGSQFGVKLDFARQPEPLGLAHAVGFTKEFVAGDSFVLYLGDAIYGGGFAEHAAKFRESGCANLNIVKPVEDPRRFGVATVEGDRIVRLVEKPAEPESNLAMAGMYFFGPELWSVLPDLKPSGRGEYEITDAIQLMIDRGMDVRAGIYDNIWFDTGTLDSYLETTAFLTGGANIIDATADVQAEIGENVVVGPGAKVSAKRLHDCVVLPGANVSALGEISRALLGGTMTLEGDARDTILWDGAPA